MTPGQEKVLLDVQVDFTSEEQAHVGALLVHVAEIGASAELAECYPGLPALIEPLTEREIRQLGLVLLLPAIAKEIAS